MCTQTGWMHVMQLPRTLPISTMRQTQVSPEELASRIFQKRLDKAMPMLMMTFDHMMANGALGHGINNYGFVLYVLIFAFDLFPYLFLYIQVCSYRLLHQWP